MSAEGVVGRLGVPRPGVPRPGVPWLPPFLQPAVGARAQPVHALLPDAGVLEGADMAWTPSFRIVASEYAGENLFDRFATAQDAEHFRAIADLSSPHASPYALHEMGHIDLVPLEGRIYGTGTGLVMATFAWPGRPSRFSDGTRGTHYAARAEHTAIIETAYHDARMLVGAGPVVLEKALIEADLLGSLVDVRAGRPAPAAVYDPSDYSAGQTFGGLIRKLGGDGIVYDSVRHRDSAGNPLGECAAVFRPPVLRNAQVTRTVEYHWDGGRIAEIR